MKKELPFQLEAILASEGSSLLPSIPKNRRPTVQRIIQVYLNEEQRNPGHEHWSMSGLTARVIAVHLGVNGQDFNLRSQRGMGYFIRRVI